MALFPGYCLPQFVHHTKRVHSEIRSVTVTAGQTCSCQKFQTPYLRQSTSLANFSLQFWKSQKMKAKFRKQTPRWCLGNVVGRPSPFLLHVHHVLNQRNMPWPHLTRSALSFCIVLFNCIGKPTTTTKKERGKNQRQQKQVRFVSVKAERPPPSITCSSDDTVR